MTSTDKVQVVSGITMPFFPMRPVMGPPVRNKIDALALWTEVNDTLQWVAQPKLNDDRVVLALVSGKVYVQNRHGTWYTKPIHNLDAWTNLPDKTVLDGGVFQGEFFAFEVLALWGKSMTHAATKERVLAAFQMSRKCGVAWMFEHPTKQFVLNRKDNLPVFDGVVLKRRNSPYIIAGSSTQESPDWIKRRWC